MDIYREMEEERKNRYRMLKIVAKDIEFLTSRAECPVNHYSDEEIRLQRLLYMQCTDKLGEIYTEMRKMKKAADNVPTSTPDIDND